MGTADGVVGVLTSMIGLLFVLILTVGTLDIEPHRRSPEDLGDSSVEGATIEALAKAR